MTQGGVREPKKSGAAEQSRRGAALFAGTQQAAALWFDLSWLPQPQIMARVLAYWRAGCKLLALEQGWLLQFEAARQLHCAQAGALVLVEQNGLLTSAPLSVEEVARCTCGSLVLASAGHLQVHALNEMQRIDPSTWLQLEQVVVLEVILPPPASTPAADIAQQIKNQARPPKSVREILGDKIAPQSEQLQDLLRSLREGKPDSMQAAQRLGRAGSLGIRISAWMQDLSEKLQRGKATAAGPGDAAGKTMSAGGGRSTGGTGGTGGTGSTGGRGTAAGGGQEVQQARPSWSARMLNQLAQKLATASGADRLLAQRQQRFMEDMLDMFAQGDLQNALRHAVPLARAEDEPSALRSFGLPGMRSDFQVRGVHGIASGIDVQEDMQAKMRKAYRASVEKLKREGKIDEAVFVLAELLRCGEEAVALLEGERRFAKAAELAQTLQLAPALRMRLLWLADRREEAVRLGLACQAFADVLPLLEKEGKASGLRMLWAQYLADSGDLLQAVKVVWPLCAPQQKDQEVRAAATRHALAWLQMAHQSQAQAGPAPGLTPYQANVIGLQLSLLPQTLPGFRAQLEALLYAPGAEAATQRMLLLEVMLKSAEPNAAICTVVRQFLPFAVAEARRDAHSVRLQTLSELLKRFPMPAFKEDLSDFQSNAATRSLSLISQPTPGLRLTHSERGLQKIEDMCRLAHNRFLLALGEAGVVLVDEKGRKLAQFAAPAQHLVLAEHGNSALALIRRDNSVRIHELDLTRRKVRACAPLPLSFWAKRYDGRIWNVVLDNQLLALDMGQSALQYDAVAGAGREEAARVFWHVGNLPGQIIDFRQERGFQVMLLENEQKFEHWRYELPARRLGAREIHERSAVVDGIIRAAWPGLGMLSVQIKQNIGGLSQLVVTEAESGRVLRLKSSLDLGVVDDVLGVELSIPFLLLTLREVGEQGSGPGGALAQTDRLRALVVHLSHSGCALKLELSFPGAKQLSWWRDEEYLLAFDDCARVVEIKLDDSSLRSLVLA